MRALTLVLASLAATLVAAAACAQITTWSTPRHLGPRSLGTHLTVFGAFALPQGDFGSTSSASTGFARRGEGLGLDYSSRFRYDIEAGSVLMVDQNSTDSQAMSVSGAATRRRFGLPSEPYRLSTTGWTTVWALARVGYAPRVGERVRAFVDVYGGGRYAHDPEIDLVGAPPGVDFFQYNRSYVGLAAGAGAGVRRGDHPTLGPMYLSRSARSAADGRRRQPISVLHATLGWAFRR